MFNEINLSPNGTKIIARDFNLVLDPDKDKLGGHADLQKASRQIVLNSMENHDLKDIWGTYIQKKNNLPTSELDPKSTLSCISS